MSPPVQPADTQPDIAARRRPTGQAPRGRGRSARLLRLTLWAAAAVMLGGVLFLALGFLQFQRAIALVEPSRAPRADGIVVLTGGAQRMRDAMGLLADGRGKRLLISGVHEKTGREEIARLTGVRRPQLDCCVDLGRGARNTIGNALEARRWAKANGFTSLLIVTSNYHMPRTIEEFVHVLGDVKVAGYPVVSEHTDGESMSTRLLAVEYAKYVVSRLRRVVESDPENSRLPVLVGRQKPLGHLPIETPGGG